MYREAVERVLGQVSFRPGLGDYTHITDTGILLQVLEDNSVPAEAGTIARIKNEFFAMLAKHVAVAGPFPEIPGAKNIVQRLHQSTKYELAIATGGWRQSACIKLTTAGFDIDGIPMATSDDAMERADIMRMALESIGTDCRSVTYFGDGTWDQRACEQLGWSFRAVGPALNGLSSYDDTRFEDAQLEITV